MRLRRKQTVVFFFLLLILSTISMVLLTQPVAGSNMDSVNNDNSQGFSIVQITDTQYLSSTYPALYTNLTNWIVANAADYNIRMVIHTGDIVDQGLIPSQWENANASMSILLNAGIPFSWCAGNHDDATTTGNATTGYYSGTPDSYWIGFNYLAFNPSYMESRPYWVSDIFEGKDTAVQFSYGNYQFLIINLEIYANQTAINWMINLINTHPTYNIIVATHSYLNGTGGYGFLGNHLWEDAVRATLNNSPNVVLTLSGHDVPISPDDLYGEATTANNTKIGNREETFFNRQHVHADQGAAAVRIYTFNLPNQLTDNQVTTHVTTFDLIESTFLNDSWNCFTFSNILLNSSAEPEPYTAVHALSSPTPSSALPTPTPLATNTPPPSSSIQTQTETQPTPTLSLPPEASTPSTLQGILSFDKLSSIENSWLLFALIGVITLVIAFKRLKNGIANFSSKCHST